jgi:hypothetical protein
MFVSKFRTEIAAMTIIPPTCHPCASPKRFVYEAFGSTHLQGKKSLRFLLNDQKKA